MSQAKVDRYKKEKANRQAIIKAEKRKQMASVTAVAAVILALAIWFVVSSVMKYQSEFVTYYETDYTAIEDYLSGLDS